jgi:hypothetical protein
MRCFLVHRARGCGCMENSPTGCPGQWSRWAPPPSTSSRAKIPKRFFCRLTHAPRTAPRTAPPSCSSSCFWAMLGSAGHCVGMPPMLLRATPPDAVCCCRGRWKTDMRVTTTHDVLPVAPSKTMTIALCADSPDTQSPCPGARRTYWTAHPTETVASPVAPVGLDMRASYISGLCKDGGGKAGTVHPGGMNAVTGGSSYPHVPGSFHTRSVCRTG